MAQGLFGHFQRVWWRDLVPSRCDGVIAVGSSGGAGLVGIWAGVGSGSGVHGSRPGSYGSATGVAGGGAFLVQVAGRGLGDLGLGREGERR